MVLLALAAPALAAREASLASRHDKSQSPCPGFFQFMLGPRSTTPMFARKLPPNVAGVARRAGASEAGSGGLVHLVGDAALLSNAAHVSLTL